MDFYDQQMQTMARNDLDLWNQRGLARIRYYIRDVPLQIEGMLDPGNSFVAILDTRDEASAGLVGKRDQEHNAGLGDDYEICCEMVVSRNLSQCGLLTSRMADAAQCSCTAGADEGRTCR